MSSEELNLVEKIHSKLSKFEIDFIRSNKEAQFKYQQFNRPGKLLFIIRENAARGINKSTTTGNQSDGFYRPSGFFKRNS